MINSKDNTPINVKKGVIYKLLKYCRKFGLYDDFIDIVNRFTSHRKINAISMSDIYDIIIDSWGYYDENLSRDDYSSCYFFPLTKHLSASSRSSLNNISIRRCSDSLWRDDYLWNWFKQYYLNVYTI